MARAIRSRRSPRIAGSLAAAASQSRRDGAGADCRARGAATRRCFERAFAEHGLPQRIRSDNGTPFAGGLAGLSRLAVWWIRLGIVPERIAPGHPEQNGSHEQFHAVLKAATARPPADTRRR